MRIIWALLFSITLLGSCREPEKKYPIPSKNDINEVIKTVITQQTIVIRFDSTGTAVTGKPGSGHFNSLDNFPLNIDLTRPWSKGDMAIFHMDAESLFKPLKHPNFMNADSLYIIFQTHLPKGLKIDTTSITNAIFTSEEQVRTIKKKGRHEYFSFYYYQMSRPLFSLDQKQAYVVMDLYYNYMAAESYAFFLKRINGKWVILWQDENGMT